MEFSDFIVYVDESGDHGLQTLDPNYPLFVLAFCIFAGANWFNRPLPLAIRFADKKTNSAGLQLADMVARPIGMSFLRPQQPNRAYDVLSRKFYGGQKRGWGLKCFP